jgi:acyl dehydratase
MRARQKICTSLKKNIFYLYFFKQSFAMSSISIGSFEDFERHLGRDLGASDYHKITQAQINKFADATIDHQWIHTDPDRAKSEGAFGDTIAHGYLTLSLVPYLWDQIIHVNNLKMMVNYGIENLRFAQPVLVNNEVRLNANLKSLVNLRGTIKAEVNVKLEIKDQKKPAFTGVLVFLYHFNS